MTWKINDQAPVLKQDRADTLELTNSALVNISYSVYPMAWMTVSLPTSIRDRLNIGSRPTDDADREACRREVLAELLPLAEAAIVALRQACGLEFPLRASDDQAMPCGTSEEAQPC